ncbi:ATP synthase subunit I [Planctomycetes bacterium Poly30]
MFDLATYALAGLVGWALGVFFFGGLWWTVRKLVASPAPARWMIASTLLRTGTTLLGFYLVSGGSWQRMLACLLGFLAGRLSVFWWTRSFDQRLHEAFPHATQS